MLYTYFIIPTFDCSTNATECNTRSQFTRVSAPTARSRHVILSHGLLSNENRADENFPRVACSIQHASSLAFAMSYDSRREQYFLYNTLSILLKAVEKTRTTVDLRNEATIVGIIENADA